MVIGNTYLYLFHAVSLNVAPTYIEYYLSQSEFYIGEAFRNGTDNTSTSSAEIWYK